MSRREPSRRAFLRGAVAAGAGVIAGCESTGGAAPRRRTSNAGERPQARSNISIPSHDATRAPDTPRSVEETPSPEAPAPEPVATKPPMEANATIRCAIIGVGGQGSRLLQELLARDTIEVVAIADAYDLWRDRALAWCSRRGETAGYVDFSEMLDREPVHVVFVAAPDHIHAPAVRAALMHGADVYVEPPLALGWADAVELAALARSQGAILGIGHESRSDSMYRYAREVLQGGDIGVLHTVHIQHDYVGQSLADFQPPVEASQRNVHWKTFLGDTEHRPFDLVRFFRWPSFCDYSNANMGVLLGPHVDTCHGLALCGMPNRVMASGGAYLFSDGRTCPDTFSVVADYPEGFQFNAMCVPVHGHAGSVERYIGSEGRLEIVDMRELRVYREDSREDWRRPEEPAHSHLDRFLEGVRSREQPEPGAASGVAEAAVCAMAMQSLLDGEVYQWDPAASAAHPTGAAAQQF